MNDFVQSNLMIIVAAVAAVVLSLAAIVVVERRQVAGLKRRLDALTRGVNDRPLEGVLDAHLESVFRVSHELNTLTGRVGTLEGESRRHYGRVGLVRFNPFDDTGGNQSFALVMLDADDNGLIISSLHSRHGTRFYAKTMTAGQCDTALSVEEEKALAQARAQASSGETRSSTKRSRSRPATAAAGWGEDEPAHDGPQAAPGDDAKS